MSESQYERDAQCWLNDAETRREAGITDVESLAAMFEWYALGRKHRYNCEDTDRQLSRMGYFLPRDAVAKHCPHPDHRKMARPPKTSAP